MEIPFHALGFHRKSPVFRADFGIVRKSSALPALSSKAAFVGRALFGLAALKCIFHALCRVLRRCVMLYFEFYGTFDFKAA